MINVKVTGSGAVIKNFDELKQRGGNMSSAFAKISQVLLQSHKYNFQQRGARFGPKWAERKYYYPWNILEKTGKLSRGFKASSTSTSAEVTNTTPYAKYHQIGTSKLPIRGLIGLAGDGGKTDINEAIQMLRKHLGLEEMEV